MEEWRRIPQAPRYEVSNLGNVRFNSFHKRYGKHRIQPVKLMVNNRGYLKFTAQLDNGKQKVIQVHSAVMAAFVGPCPLGKEVCHRNGVRSDARLENLRYGTPSDNRRDSMEHGTWWPGGLDNRSTLASTQ